MGVKMSGETMQSFNNSSRRCAHASAIFSPPGCALPELGVSREAIVFTTRYVRQQGAKAGHTVGIEQRRDKLHGDHTALLSWKGCHATSVEESSDDCKLKNLH